MASLDPHQVEVSGYRLPDIESVLRRQAGGLTHAPAESVVA
jgi:hypothetical protein